MRHGIHARLVPLGMTIALLGGALVSSAAPAAANPAWSVQKSANPSAASFAELLGVSCPSTGSCFAVGTFLQGATKRLIEHWNGSAWSIMPSPLPNGSTSSQLRSISCPTLTSCFAVGSYANGPTGFNLIMHWNGRSWAIMDSPNPGPSSRALVAISCPAPKSCFAVGSHDTTSSANQTMVEHWDGIGWSLMSSPNPAGPAQTVLYGVSCPAPTSCFAIGYYSSGLGDRMLAEHWNGSSWGVMTSANPSDSTGTDPNGIWCPSTSSCFGVGSYTHGANTKSLIEHWNGSNWSVMGHPNPLGSSLLELNGVTCPTTKSCFAVGAYSNGSYGKAMIEHWNGSSWGIMSNPNPGGAGLWGVSCPATQRCFATGEQGTPTEKTLVDRYA